MTTDQRGDITILYLELMKKSLTGALAEDNDSILGGVRTSGSNSLRKRVANLGAAMAARLNLEVVYKKPYDPALRETGRDWPARAESMIGLRRMSNIQDCIRVIVQESVPGDLIEAGVWRGGACIFMKANLVALGDDNRTVWVADSFEGLPKPDPARYPADTGDMLHRRGGLGVGADQVRHNFDRYGLLDDRVKFLVGWFKDTLPKAPVESLALMRLDGDLYQSTWESLDALYPKLSPGGFCIIDDFGSHESQAGKAVHEYRRVHEIEEPIEDIDGYGAFWRKRR